jgi:hypothetical protein
VDETKEKTKKTGRQLYNTTDYLDHDETANSSTQPLTKGKYSKKRCQAMEMAFLIFF